MRLMGWQFARMYLLVASIFLSVVLPACAPSVKVPPVSSGTATTSVTEVKVGYTTAMSALPFWVALDSGIFEKYGLRVKATNVQGGPANGLPATANGEFDVWLGAMDSYIVWCSKQTVECPVTAVGSVYHWAENGIYVPEGSPIRKASDLKGKTVGIINRGSQSDFVLQAWLKKVGLQPQVDVQVRAMGGAPAVVSGLETKQIDAANLSPPSTYTVLGEGMSKVVDIQSELGPYESEQEIVSRAFLQQHRDVITAWLEATYEGLAVARTDKSRALAAAQKYSGTTDPTVLSESYQDILPLLNDRPYHDQQAVQNVIAALQGLPSDYGINIAPDVDPASFYTDSLVQAVDNAGFYKKIDGQYGLKH